MSSFAAWTDFPLPSSLRIHVGMSTTVHIQQLRNTADLLRSLSRSIGNSRALGLHALAGPDTWIGPTAQSCYEQLLHTAAVDDPPAVVGRHGWSARATRRRARTTSNCPEAGVLMTVLAFDRNRLEALRSALAAALQDLHQIRSDDIQADDAMRCVRSASRTLGDTCMPRVHDILTSTAMTWFGMPARRATTPTKRRW